MRNVQMVRDRIARGFNGELGRLRIYLSQTDGNEEAVDKLRGDPGLLLLAKVTDMVIRELGHESESSVENPASHVRRTVARVHSGGDEEGDRVRKSAKAIGSAAKA